MGEQDSNPKYISIDVSIHPDITKITLEEAIELLKYPLILGKYDGSDVLLKKGQFGFYISNGQKNISVETDTLTLEEAIETIEKRVQTNSNLNKVLEKIKENYKNRGINLICIKSKWSFRTAEDLSKLMSLQKTTAENLSSGKRA